MHIGARVKLSKEWAIAHPRCKPRGYGRIANIETLRLGCVCSVRWDGNPKAERYHETELVLLFDDDRRPDATIR